MGRRCLTNNKQALQWSPKRPLQELKETTKSIEHKKNSGLPDPGQSPQPTCVSAHALNAKQKPTMSNDQYCCVSRCNNSAQYHVQFTDDVKEQTYISRSYPYCSEHTQIGWFVPPKSKKEKGKWVGGWVPKRIYSIHDNYGDSLNVKAVRAATRRF